MTARAWRLLITEPADGATNMAIDEAIWRSRQTGASPPTLRFFAWAPPTVSLGYGQPLDRHVDLDACRSLGVGPGAPADRRQRHLPRRARARADLQRGRHRRRPRDRLRSARDLPLDRRRSPARLVRARRARRAGPRAPAGRAGPRVLLRPHRRVRDRGGRSQDRRQRAAPAGRFVPAARRGAARHRRAARARAVPDHARSAGDADHAGGGARTPAVVLRGRRGVDAGLRGGARPGRASRRSIGRGDGARDDPRDRPLREPGAGSPRPRERRAGVSERPPCRRRRGRAGRRSRAARPSRQGALVRQVEPARRHGRAGRDDAGSGPARDRGRVRPEDQGGRGRRGPGPGRARW